MLALKLVLAGTSSVPTLIFDEVDSGIGGRRRRGGWRAAAAARLAAAGARRDPFAAGRRARRRTIGASPRNKVSARPSPRSRKLDADTRQEEIARMLSGSTITAEARAAAASLIAGARP